MSIAITTNQPRHSADGDPRSAGASAYWNDRARRYATRGAGLGAVCSYGMPWFYNASIDCLQYLTLARWLRVPSGTRVLEVGCGVGRWSRRLAARGAHVTGIDLSHAMVREAQRRARDGGVADRCRFLVADVCAPAVRGQFDVVLSVTVLQHLLEQQQLEKAVGGIRAHLAAGGTALLLEAAPTRPTGRCNSAVFVARETRTYLETFRAAGLECAGVVGMDPSPFKTWFLPWYRRLPRPLALSGLAAVSAAGFALDSAWGRRMPRRSWHKLFVLKPVP